MKSYIYKSILLFGISIAVLSCTNSDKYQNVSNEVQTYTLTTNKTVASIYTTSAIPTVYSNDDVIEAYVTSNDNSGTFYKSISLQDVQTSSGTPLGFSISLDQTELYAKGLFPGRKVYIKLKGLALANVYGSMQIGLVDPADNTKITGISGLDMQNFVFPSPVIVDENTLVRHVSLATAATDPYQNTLLEIDNVQFADNSIARSYFDIDSGGFATNHDIVDATTAGTTRYCRVSKYANFSANSTPSGRGSIRGVMTKYSSDFQFIVRGENDFKLTNPRTYNFTSSLNETFTTFASNQVCFPNYLNFSPVGTKKWLIKSGAIEMSSYGGAVERNKAYFLVPVDMTAANTMKFDIKVGFFTNNLGLKVYRTSDYVPGMKISSATLNDITTSFILPSASTTVFATAGTYTIPTTVTGNGYFVFEYTGTNISTGPPVTTTIDIDNIVVN